MAKEKKLLNPIGAIAIEADNSNGKTPDPDAIKKALITAIKAIPDSKLKKLKNGRITVLV